MKSEDYWLFATAFFVAYGFFTILKVIMGSDYLIEISFGSLGFSFMLIGLVKHSMEKAETKQK
jgi:ABC-type uncharacterized transport system permease subunit